MPFTGLSLPKPSLNALLSDATTFRVIRRVCKHVFEMLRLSVTGLLDIDGVSTHAMCNQTA